MSHNEHRHKFETICIIESLKRLKMQEIFKIMQMMKLWCETGET